MGLEELSQRGQHCSGLKFPNGVRLYVSYILPLIVLFIFVMGYWNKFVG